MVDSAEDLREATREAKEELRTGRPQPGLGTRIREGEPVRLVRGPPTQVGPGQPPVARVAVMTPIPSGEVPLASTQVKPMTVAQTQQSFLQSQQFPQTLPATKEQIIMQTVPIQAPGARTATFSETVEAARTFQEPGLRITDPGGLEQAAFEVGVFPIRAAIGIGTDIRRAVTRPQEIPKLASEVLIERPFQFGGAIRRGEARAVGALGGAILFGEVLPRAAKSLQGPVEVGVDFAAIAKEGEATTQVGVFKQVVKAADEPVTSKGVSFTRAVREGEVTTALSDVAIKPPKGAIREVVAGERITVLPKEPSPGIRAFRGRGAVVEPFAEGLIAEEVVSRGFIKEIPGRDVTGIVSEFLTEGIPLFRRPVKGVARGVVKTVKDQKVFESFTLPKTPSQISDITSSVRTQVSTPPIKTTAPFQPTISLPSPRVLPITEPVTPVVPTAAFRDVGRISGQSQTIFLAPSAVPPGFPVVGQQTPESILAVKPEFVSAKTETSSIRGLQITPVKEQIKFPLSEQIKDVGRPSRQDLVQTPIQTSVQEPVFEVPRVQDLGTRTPQLTETEQITSTPISPIVSPTIPFVPRTQFQQIKPKRRPSVIVARITPKRPSRFTPTVVGIAKGPVVSERPPSPEVGIDILGIRRPVRKPRKKKTSGKKTKRKKKRTPAQEFGRRFSKVIGL